jgi:hypothetical protein
MTSLNIITKKKLDDYNTPLYAWEILLNYLNLDKNKIIYEPFYNDGAAKEYLGKLGYNKVIHFEENFFDNYDKYEYDIIISNPPYSIKKNILKILYMINKPFVLIMPTAIISKLYLKNIFKENIADIQYIIPNRRLHFELNGFNKKRTPFDTLFFCYKMNLQRDIIYL